MTAQTGGSRTAALHMCFRQSWNHLSNQRCGRDVTKRQSVGPPARKGHGTEAKLLSPDQLYGSSLESVFFKFCSLSVHIWCDWGNSKCTKMQHCKSLLRKRRQSHFKWAVSKANLESYLQRWKKPLIWGWKSFAFVCPSTAGNYINVNQMLDLLTLGSCHVIEYIKRAKDGT